MPTHTAPWLSPDFATAAGNLSRGGALLLFAVAIWFIIPMAGWVPTDPIQNKPTEVWRALPNGTAQRVPATGGTANNSSGGAPSYAPAPASQFGAPGGGYAGSWPGAGRRADPFAPRGAWAWTGRRFPAPWPRRGRMYNGFGGGFFGGGRRRW